MKKLILFLYILIQSLYSFSQEDEYYRIVDWKFYPDSIVQLSDSTYILKAIPFDYSDPGSNPRIVGNYVSDFVGRRFKVIDSTLTTITIYDFRKQGQAPQSNQISRCYRSVGNGESQFIGSTDYSPFDESARWKLNGADNELLWRHGIEYESPFKRVVTDTTYIPTGFEPKGTIFWDNDNNTLSVSLGNGVVGQVFEEDIMDGQNNTGATILNGTPVMYEGSIGNSGNFRIKPAYASASEPAYLFVGIATEDIPDGAVGKINTRGKVRGISTDGSIYGETWLPSNLVYVSETPGYLTNVPPNAPIPAIPVALVISAHTTNGTIEVRPTFPQRLQDLPDVNGTPLTITGQIPVWNNDSTYFDFDYKLWGITDGLIQSESYNKDTWDGQNLAAPSKDVIRDKFESIAAIDYCPDTTIVNKGTISSGLISNLCSKDGNTLTVTEVSGADPLRITFTFVDVVRMNYLVFYGAYMGGASHILNVEILNPNTTTWEFLGNFGLDATPQWHSFPIYQPSTYISGGSVQIRFNHQGSGNPLHYIVLDYVDINFGGGGGGVTIIEKSLNVKSVYQVAHGFVIGDAIYLSDKFYKAKADTISTSDVIGIVTDTFSVDSFQYAYAGIISGTYTKGVNYFLSNSVAGAVVVEPTYEIGDVRQFIGTGLDSNQLLLEIDIGYEIMLDTVGNGSGTSPGGVDGNIQYNNAGVFAGFGDWDGNVFTVSGTNGKAVKADYQINTQLNGAKTSNFTHDCKLGDVGGYQVNLADLTLGLHNLVAGMQGTIFLNYVTTTPTTLTVNAYSDAGSTAITVRDGTPLFAVNKTTTVTYTCVNDGTNTYVFIVYSLLE